MFSSPSSCAAALKCTRCYQLWLSADYVYDDEKQQLAEITEKIEKLRTIN
jgi:hypothetical protein